MTDHFYVTLEGFPADSGDVISTDGEVIGAYTCDDNDYCEFTPNGADEPVVSGYNIGPFCSEVAEWHKGQQSA
ncbi:hypothetical protein [Litoreibacter arenae]|uniref:Uncharacterized protein n=1 Tax=Litoreibacter arenae DSM 19593 TaxID=1123360 RepID=S9QN19_9RHOB|nr:hypothetical protein [Litoreibacter arenae]EPX81008.1 hypothetical protein thalar_00453 [Litoreibacter arenae DSM 19593]